MPMTCTICKHQDRNRIDTAIASGASLRDIARQFQVSKDAVQRHQAGIGEALTKMRTEREAEIAVTVEEILARTSGR